MGIRIIEKPLTVFSDLLAINIAFFAAVWLRYVSHLFPETYTPHIDMLSFINYTLFLINCMWIFLFFVNGLYREWYRESRFDEFILIARTVAIGILFVFVLTSSKQIIEFASCGDLRVLFTRTKVATLMTYGGCMLFFSAFFRLAIHSFLFFLFSRGIGISKVLIIGANRSGKKLVREIHAYARLGYRVCGFIDDDKWKKDALYAGYKVLGTYADLPSVVKKQKIPAIIITHLSGSPSIWSPRWSTSLPATSKHIRFSASPSWCCCRTIWPHGKPRSSASLTSLYRGVFSLPAPLCGSRWLR
jgi:FlaA1/EpsC-like NDP-sugar epimerase